MKTHWQTIDRQRFSSSVRPAPCRGAHSRITAAAKGVSPWMRRAASRENRPPLGCQRIDSSTSGLPHNPTPRSLHPYLRIQDTQRALPTHAGLVRGNRRYGNVQAERLLVLLSRWPISATGSQQAGGWTRGLRSPHETLSEPQRERNRTRLRKPDRTVAKLPARTRNSATEPAPEHLETCGAPILAEHPRRPRLIP